MLRLEHPGLDISRGEHLSSHAYRQDFRDLRWSVDGRDCWKLERRQTFQEPSNASWQAFSRGDLVTASRLIERSRDGLTELGRTSERHRSHFFRVRVVEKPLTPYLRWELNSLRVRAELLGGIRVVSPEHLATTESEEPLPEIVTLAGHTLYQILYDAGGILEGAVRVTDSAAVTRWEEFIGELYERGEELESYCAREVPDLTGLPCSQPE
ncbi:DUF6879 family protein [Streptomyces iconiensis]|uniref:DUF6879 domain-containing protein n=1 Tax=Streptomyces iconiensis TaxID=1384038 RepID=A0ABT6ZSU6_9ACTN|nr:DUF6879 family protein [Streptomyces iconiensis]MDJ1131711.1 hypothetical protein [Streptomyces iconiensis]